MASLAGRVTVGPCLKLGNHPVAHTGAFNDRIWGERAEAMDAKSFPEVEDE